MANRAVVALGGNALLRGDQRGTAQEQVENIRTTLESMLPLLASGCQLAIGHGNGPQVGNVLMQHAGGEEKYSIPQFPLDVCGAETEGSIGYLVVRELRNVLRAHGIDRQACCMITQTLVSRTDPAFTNPTKRVGRIYDKASADALAAAKGWEFREEVRTTGRGWRRVVPSPVPAEVLNAKLVEQLVAAGVIVVCAGGGGIPVARNAQDNLEGVEAVIDKDLACSLLASAIGAQELYILTDVPYVYLNFHTPQEQRLERVARGDIQRYLAQGMFGEGNMAPKIRACVQFLERGGHVSIITEAGKLGDPNVGTRIVL